MLRDTKGAILVGVRHFCDSEDRDVSKLVVWINNFTPL